MHVSRHVAVGGIVVMAVVALGIGAGLVLLGRPDHHADGEGPLASLDRQGTHVGMVVDRIGQQVWTFGYRLCLAQGSQPAIIESVAPTQTIGTGFMYLGSLMRTFDWEPGVNSRHEGIGGVAGFPPPARYAPDFLRDAIGYPVSVLCQDGPPITYTELLVGFAAAGSDGGGWLGIDVGYSVGGHHYTVSIAYDQLICGASTADRCTSGTATDPPSSP